MNLNLNNSQPCRGGHTGEASSADDDDDDGADVASAARKRKCRVPYPKQVRAPPFPTRTAAGAAVNSSHVYLFMKFSQPQLSFEAAASMLSVYRKSSIC